MLSNGNDRKISVVNYLGKLCRPGDAEKCLGNLIGFLQGVAGHKWRGVAPEPTSRVAVEQIDAVVSRVAASRGIGYDPHGNLGSSYGTVRPYPTVRKPWDW
jgi:hypothetical protein